MEYPELCDRLISISERLTAENQALKARLNVPISNKLDLDAIFGIKPTIKASAKPVKLNVADLFVRGPGRPPRSIGEILGVRRKTGVAQLLR